MTNEKSFARWTLESQDGFAGLRFSENHTLRPLGDDDVFVQMHAASLNYRDLVIAKVTDDLLVRHSRNSDLDRSLRIYYMDHPRIILFSAADSPLQGELNLPFRPGVIPGSDGSGVVIEVGKSVIAFEVGDRVCTHMVPSMADNVFPTMSHISAGMGETVDGTMTEYGVFHSSTLIPMPRNLEFGPAATLTCSALTAWNALFGLRGRELKQGDWVLVQGTGGVSMAALQFAIAAGAHTIATTSSDAKRKCLEDLGAEVVLNYKSSPAWGETSKSLTPNQRGVDFVVDVGGNATLGQSLKAVRVDGIVAAVGLLGEASTQAPLLLDALVNVCVVRGVLLGTKEMFRDMNAFIDKHEIIPAVDPKQFPLRQAREAYERMESQQHFAKVIITMQHDERAEGV